MELINNPIKIQRMRVLVAQKHNFLRSFLLCLLFFIGLNSHAQNSKKIDSLKVELSKTTDKKERSAIHRRLAAFYKVVDPKKGLDYGKLAKKEAEELKWAKGIAYSAYEIGSIYRIRSEYPKSLESLFEALRKAEKLKDDKLIGLSLSEIAVVYRHTDNLEKARNYAEKALISNKKANNKTAQIQNYNELAIVNVQLKNLEKALENFEEAYQLCLGENQLRNAAVIIGNKGIVYKDLKQWQKSIEAYEEATRIHKEQDFDMGVGLAHQNIGGLYLEYYNDSIDGVGLKIPRHKVLDLALDHLSLTVTSFDKYNALDDISVSHKLMSDIYFLKKDHKNALLFFKRHQALRDSIDSNDDKVKVANLGEERAELEKKQQTKIAQQQIKLTTLVEEKRRNETIAFIVGIIILLIFTIFVFRERRKSERLLLNILPESVAAELKKKGSADAQLFGDVTVLFTDFVGFTTVSERLTPKELVNELDTCFRAFDHIMGRHSIEKIKTVGDAYLAVCGLPEENPKHAENVVKASLEILEFMKARKKVIGDNTFEIRVGIHTGNVVAGIVGVKKFAYDIWGDTVNTAARMEQNSEPGKINVSSSTHALIQDSFSTEYRGEISAKNKGKLSMYFIN
jgi:class 3 adenylate cyclase